MPIQTFSYSVKCYLSTTTNSADMYRTRADVQSIPCEVACSRIIIAVTNYMVTLMRIL